ncbi:MAG: NUDIX domain-containing protein [Pseudomonadota bacterium]
MSPIFLYGTLLHAPLREVVAGHVPAQPAQLADHAVSWAGTADYPRIDPVAGAVTRGILVEGVEAEARLDFYEGGYGYSLREVVVETDDGLRAARAYWPGAAIPEAGAPWSLEDWVTRHAARTLYAAQETMGYFGQIDAETLAKRRSTIGMRAHSRVLAETEPSPAPLAPLPPSDVDVEVARTPYSQFFALAEYDVRHRKFDGSMGPLVNRAALIAADAVVVLPYDPVRDRVHLIDQFRFGPYFRGDPQRFLIEAVAGRIDPGETPEETARREAQEEAGLSLGHLHEVARCYPSPGAMTEFLYIYVGEADLPDGAAQMGGLEEEAEDIRSHILEYATFEARLDSGGFNVGPLIIAGQWLARNRARLRASAR